MVFLPYNIMDLLQSKLPQLFWGFPGPFLKFMSPGGMAVPKWLPRCARCQRRSEIKDYIPFSARRAQVSAATNILPCREINACDAKLLVMPLPRSSMTNQLTG